MSWRRFVVIGVAASLAHSVLAVAAERYVEQGVAIEVTTEPLGSAPTGQDVRLTVQLSDAASGAPLAAANPAAWLSLNRRGSPPSEPICRREVAAYLGANPFVRPDVDLTGFTLAVMNRDPTVTVLDPQRGFGGSRMLAMLPLELPGLDMAVGLNPPRLYVTEPAARRLGVIDTERWQRPVNVALTDAPAAVLLQHDELRLWVAAARDGAATAIATDDLAVAARIPVGGGAHLLAMTGDDHRLLITNQDDGSVTVIDSQELGVVATVPAGSAPRAMVISALAGLAYVAVADSIAVIDPARAALTGRIDGVAGVAAMAISPDGRWGFAANPDANKVFIFDTSTNHLVQTMTVENAPFQIAFTDSEAYIRRRGSEAVTLVPLAPLRAEGQSVGHGEFPAGEKPVAASAGDTLAASMAAVPGEASMLLASPAEHAIHYYHEGMAAPTDSFDDLGHQPSALRIIDRGLRQTERGTYSTTARLPKPGVYDLTLLLDSPRVAHCFTLNATSGFGAGATAARLEPVTLPRTISVGRPVGLAFRATRSSAQPVAARSATATALVILSPGSWYQRIPMVPADDSIWRLEFTPPRAGAYLITFDAPDLGLDVDSGAHFAVEANGSPEPGHE